MVAGAGSRPVIPPSWAVSSYTSLAFGEHGRQWGVVPPMGQTGDACFDNAMTGGFFATPAET